MKGEIMNSTLPNERYAAAREGSTKYFTGKACKYGHVAARRTDNGMCCACASEKAAKAWNAGKRQSKESMVKSRRNWNASQKAKEAKQRWKEKDPKRAWAVYATGTAKGRARIAGVEFNLTSDYVQSITPDCCPIFETPFKFIGNKKPSPESATLDRIIPEDGYVVGNVAVISMKANMIKSAYTSEDVKKVADWLRVLESK